jgi:hypothetical protein
VKIAAIDAKTFATAARIDATADASAPSASLLLGSLLLACARRAHGPP